MVSKHPSSWRRCLMGENSFMASGRVPIATSTLVRDPRGINAILGSGELLTSCRRVSVPTQQHARTRVKPPELTRAERIFDPYMDLERARRSRRPLPSAKVPNR